MKKILITGGTTFVSRYMASYFSNRGYDVYVLNRGTKEQVPGATLIKADRHRIDKGLFAKMHFEAVLDITAYTKEDITDLLDGLCEFDQYIMLSSSAVYPEYEPQPFKEELPLAENKFWGKYGTDKIAAEQELQKRVPDAYILRPPYLYGEMNNVYREAFVFECAMRDRKFYLPKDGSMQLQFFHVEDLCWFMERLMEEKPDQHIFNVGNPETISVRDWVTLCYSIVGKEPHFIPVNDRHEQRDYFSFYDYEYKLDVTKQQKWLKDTLPLEEGFRRAYEWYLKNADQVKVKPYFEYIKEHFE